MMKHVAPTMIRESHELGWCFINALFEATIKIPAFFS
jgi:hypothetical protein